MEHISSCGEFVIMKHECRQSFNVKQLYDLKMMVASEGEVLLTCVNCEC